ncbi:MAG: RNA polymerase sigma factor [Planctomycetota bacterium]|jgi:RNA polymerase sigma-70 factor (ECF subfamily)
MLEDKLLVWKFKNGSRDALQRIYEKYKNDLLALAIALSNDKSAAEDVVHDVFVSFAEFVVKLQLRGSLKSYLSTCVANRVRNLNRLKTKQTIGPDEAQVIDPDFNGPVKFAVSAEQAQRITYAMEQLPYEQREAIILHLHSGMKFGTIAKRQNLSVNTIQSRYRYGLDKLQSILNGEVKK